MTKLKSIELLLQDRKLDRKNLNKVKGGMGVGVGGGGGNPPPEFAKAG